MQAHGKDPRTGDRGKTQIGSENASELDWDASTMPAYRDEIRSLVGDGGRVRLLNDKKRRGKLRLGWLRTLVKKSPWAPLGGDVNGGHEESKLHQDRKSMRNHRRERVGLAGLG